MQLFWNVIQKSIDFSGLYSKKCYYLDYSKEIRLPDAELAKHLGGGAVAMAVEVTQIGVHIGGRHFSCVVETLGARDAGKHHALDVVLVAAPDAVAHQFGVLAWPV